MLVLSRRPNEKILFPTLNASVQVVTIKPGVVRLGISAPADVPVVREEVHQRMAQWRSADGPAPHPSPAKDPMAGIVRNRLRIAVDGLDLLHRQMQQGRMEAAEATWAEVFDDLQSLRHRLHDEEARPVIKPQKHFKALLVEDDRNERELLASFLRMGGVDVDTAGDGSDALDYLRDCGRPDVVLLDMGLPRCNGAEAVREIRRNPRLRDLKIFAVTGHLPEEYNLATGPSGIDRWFQKPLDPLALLRDINQSFDKTAITAKPVP
jgi:carbon storage regulator CsrA